MKKLLLLLMFTLLIGSLVSIRLLAQPRPPVPSPTLHDDGTITFRYDGPDASEVLLSAEFLSEDQPLTPDEESGLWSITLGPVDPDIYPYFFKVDGISVADPTNPDYFPNEQFKRSIIDIPADQPLIHDRQDVPHGEITYQYYESSTLGLTRLLAVYTPPGYDPQADQQYPVLYLIHGMTDTEETWVKVGRVNFILDNLIAQGKAQPMIVVMPYANPYPALMKKDPSVRPDYLATDRFVKELMQEVIPYVENTYRVASEASQRAIAGFSLGGRQTLAAGLSQPDRFAYVCAFAPAIFEREFDQTFSELYTPAKELNQLELLWVSCGRSDFLHEASTEFLSVLDEKGIKYESMFTEGGHTWMNVRTYLATTAPKLFQ